MSADVLRAEGETSSAVAADESPATGGLLEENRDHSSRSYESLRRADNYRAAADIDLARRPEVESRVEAAAHDSAAAHGQVAFLTAAQEIVDLAACVQLAKLQCLSHASVCGCTDRRLSVFEFSVRCNEGLGATVAIGPKCYRRIDAVGFEPIDVDVL